MQVVEFEPGCWCERRDLKSVGSNCVNWILFIEVLESQVEQILNMKWKSIRHISNFDIYIGAFSP